MTNTYLVFCAELMLLLGFSQGCKTDEHGQPGKPGTHSNEVCCITLSHVRYVEPAEHDLDFTNAVMVYPMGSDRRLRVNAIFDPEVHGKYDVREGDYFSKDQGETWYFEKSAIPEGLVRDLGPHPANSSFRYRIVTQSDGAWAPRWIERSENGGISWHKTKAILQGFNRPLTDFMLPIGYYHPNNPKTMIVYCNGLREFYDECDVVLRSDDGGEFFRIWYTVPAAVEERIIAISPSDPRIIYINGFYGSIMKSDDGGQTFRPVGMNDEIRKAPILERDKASRKGNDPNWSRARQILVHPWNANIVYAVTARGVLRSKDGGQNWCAMNIGIESGGTMINMEVDPKDPKTIYVGTLFGLFRSRDDGCHWDKINIYSRIAK